MLSDADLGVLRGEVKEPARLDPPLCFRFSIICSVSITSDRSSCTRPGEYQVATPSQPFLAFSLPECFWEGFQNFELMHSQTLRWACPRCWWNRAKATQTTRSSHKRGRYRRWCTWCSLRLSAISLHRAETQQHFWRRLVNLWKTKTAAECILRGLAISQHATCACTHHFRQDW